MIGLRQFVYPGSRKVFLDESGETHIVRPVGVKKLEELRGNGLKKVFLGKGTFKRLSGKAKKFLEEQGIEKEFCDERGKPLKADLELVPKIVEMRGDYCSYRKIAEELGIPKSSVHYLVKYAKRAKIRDKDRVMGF